MIKTLLLVVVLTTNSEVRLFSYEFPSKEECKSHVQETVDMTNTALPDVDTVIAMCTSDLQTVKGITT